MLNVVLVQPQIPPNTGNIARLCAAMQCPLHLVRPLGFSTDDRTLKRAGLDYWPYVDLHYHDSLEEIEEQNSQNPFYYLTTKSNRPYTEAEFLPGAFIVFGSETKGLTDRILKPRWEKTLTIPMTGPIRSLNLSTSVAMVLGEALRQMRSVANP